MQLSNATKIYVLSILLICISGSSYAQKKRTYQPPPPPPKVKTLTHEEALYPNIVERIIKTAETTPCFRWYVNQIKDTLLQPDELFTEIIEFTGDVESRSKFVIDSVNLEVGQTQIYKSVMLELKGFKVKYNKETIILIDEKNEKKTRTFKVFLDQPKKNIIKMQEINTGRIYWPAKFEGPTIMMGR